MNQDITDLCCNLIPGNYVKQGVQARRSHEHKIRHLLQHVSTSTIIICKIDLGSTWYQCYVLHGQKQLRNVMKYSGTRITSPPRDQLK